MVTARNLENQNTSDTSALLDEIQVLKEELKSRDKFLSIMAHDLKSPLGMIIGFSDLLSYTDPNDHEKLKLFLDIIVKSAKNATNLLENFLLWSRVKTGSQKCFLCDIAISTIIIDIIMFFDETIKTKNITILLDLKSGKLIADQTMTTFIMKSVIYNAIQFSPAYGFISISTTIENNSCVITIKDDGKGMNEQDVADIFRIEKKKASVTDENEQGTGLSLIICKEYAHLCSGDVIVKSREGAGTEVLITLPLSINQA